MTPRALVASEADATPVTVIRPSHGWMAVDWQELWAARELLGLLVARDLKVRYKQTILGAAWAILQPFCTMVVFSIFFGRLARVPSDGLPYPIFSYCALLPWQLFANTVTAASNSLVANQHLVTKVYFPRLLMPLATVVTGLVDFAVAFLVLAGLMAFYGIAPSPAAWTLPSFLLLGLGAALGIGLWLSALNVQYRDVRYVVPFLLQLWLFITPVAYPTSLVPEGWRAVYGLNPMASVIEGFRWALLGKGQAPGAMTAWSVVMVLVLLGGGVACFRRMERRFADII